MYHLLSDRFQFQKGNMVRLYHEAATRNGILKSWYDLIQETSDGDIAVIYYSGHGGMAEPDPDARARGPRSQDGLYGGSNNESDNPKRLQFLVPVDYDKEAKNWAGILDGEISKLLLKTTAKTPNVTYILDCCHSSRLGRAPPVATATETQLKFTSGNYDHILTHWKTRKANKELLDDEMWSNPKLVRISASSDTKAALQCKRGDDRWAGMLTQKLKIVLDQGAPLPSWRNIMLGVNALFEGEFAHDAPERQEPRSGGADDRIPFSLEVDLVHTVVADLSRSRVLILGGRIRGIEKGDVFSLTPLLRDPKSAALVTNPTFESQTTTITKVNAFFAVGSEARLDGYVMAHLRARGRYRFLGASAT